MEKVKYHKTLSTYFSAQHHFFDGNQQKKPHIRKSMELPFQQTKAEMWDEVTNTLCDLEFIQAKACAKMTYDLVNDFNEVLEKIPDNAENIRKEKARQARMDKYTRDLIAYAKGEIKELEVPETVPLKSEEEFNAEIERIKTNLTRLDRLKDFTNFLGQEAGNLHSFANEFPHFAIQLGWNFSDNGPVGKHAGGKSNKILNNLLLQSESTRPKWDPISRKNFSLVGHNKGIKSCAITPDGLKAVSADIDYCILWDLKTGRLIKKLLHYNSFLHSYDFKCVDISSDGESLITVECCYKVGSIIRLWNTINYKSRIIYDGPEGINSVSIIPNGKRAISGSNESNCTFWDLEKGEVIFILRGHSGSVNTVGITANGKRGISGSDDGMIVYWNLENGQKISELILDSPVKSVALTPNGQRSLIGARQLLLWDPINEYVISAFKDFTSYIMSVSITPNAQKAISVNFDGIIYLWDLTFEKKIDAWKGSDDTISCGIISACGISVTTGSWDNKFSIWNLNYRHDKSLHMNYDQSGRSICGFVIRDVKIFPNGLKAITCSNGNCIVWDLKNGAMLCKLNGYDSGGRTVAISPDNRIAVTGMHDCVIWDTETGQVLNIFKGHTKVINEIKITSDGSRIVTGSDDCTCLVLDLNNGKYITRLQNHKGSITSLIITPDGRRAISGSADNNCYVWDLDSEKAVLKFSEHKASIVQLALSPDGKIVMTVCENHWLFLWALDSGDVIYKHNYGPKQIQVTRDGKWLIPGFYLKSLSPLKKPKLYDDLIDGFDLSSNGNVIINSYQNGMCMVENFFINKRICMYASPSRRNDIIRYFPGGIFLVEGHLGKKSILKINNEILCPSYCNVTIRRVWDFKIRRYLDPSAICPTCGNKFSPKYSILLLIENIYKKFNLKNRQSPCLNLPDEAWEEPGLLENCPKCGAALKFNPFIAGGDYKPKTNWKFWKS